MTASTRARRREPREPETLIALVDGPMVGQWYSQDDWKARLEAAEYMAGKGQRRSACLGYRRGRGEVPHPSEPMWVGQPWKWTGGL